MPRRESIDGSEAVISYFEEQSVGVLDPVVANRVSYGLLVNPGTNPFGGEQNTVERELLGAGGQRSKGTIVSQSGAVSLGLDFTVQNLQHMLQGFFRARHRAKTDTIVDIVTAGAYTPTGVGAGFDNGDLIFAKFFTDAGNNGLKTASGTSVVANVPVNEVLTAATGQRGIISRVGYQFGGGEVAIVVTNPERPRLTRVGGTKDFTTLGLSVGEFVFVGGDGAGETFTNNATGAGIGENNGLKRISQIGTDFLEFDKSDQAMTAEGGAGLTIPIYMSRWLRNETDRTRIVRIPYRIERQLGAPDTDFPNIIQAEYLRGCIANEWSLSIPTQGKMENTIGFFASGLYECDGTPAEPLIPFGTRVDDPADDPVNTSTDVASIRMGLANQLSPMAFFDHLSDLTLSVNNNANVSTAVQELVGFNVSQGTFAVEVSGNVYFIDIAPQRAARQNADISLHLFVASSNLYSVGRSGFIIDNPLGGVQLGDKTTENNSQITIPFTFTAATARRFGVDFDYTLGIGWFDYLPDLALQATAEDDH